MSARIRRHPALPLLIAALAPGAGLAADNVSAPRVDIIGHKENLDRIPGSAYTIDRDTLESTRVFTTNEALRKIPGINARDEEGMGLRPNIGIRGLNPTRSTKLTLLEDGIPLSYAPYGDNATYYHPPIERFDRIEVLKGAGQVLYGPQTVGGVINYVTPTPPQDFRGSIALSSGNRGFFNARAQLGGDGFLLDLMRKHSDGARNNTHSELSDVNLKKVVALGGQHAQRLGPRRRRDRGWRRLGRLAVGCLEPRRRQRRVAEQLDELGPLRQHAQVAAGVLLHERHHQLQAGPVDAQELAADDIGLGPQHAAIPAHHAVEAGAHPGLLRGVVHRAQPAPGHAAIELSTRRAQPHRPVLLTGPERRHHAELDALEVEQIARQIQVGCGAHAEGRQRHVAAARRHRAAAAGAGGAGIGGALAQPLGRNHLAHGARLPDLTDPLRLPRAGWRNSGCGGAQ